MPHDVFISYSTSDKVIADAVCARLEDRKIRCWMAPRDVPAGKDFAGAIIEAIDQCHAFVLIWSAEANRSQHILNEVNRAFNQGVTVIPFRIEDVQPTKSLEYYIGRTHWLDALTPPLERHIERLAETVVPILRVAREPEAAGLPAVAPGRGEEPVVQEAPTAHAAARRRRGLPRGLWMGLSIGGVLVLAVFLRVRLLANLPTSQPFPSTAAAEPSLTATPNLVPMAANTLAPGPTETSRAPGEGALVSIVQSFAAPGQSSFRRSIAWDGANLWVSEHSLTFFKMDTSGRTLGAFESPVYGGFLTWDSSSQSLFAAGCGEIAKFTLEGTQTKLISSFDPPEGSCDGDVNFDLEWDGENLWYANQYNIFRLTPSGEVLRSFAFPKSVVGLAWDGAHLWLADHHFPDNATLYVVDAEGNMLGSFSTPVFQITGLAWGDGSLWAVGQDELGGDAMVYELDVTSAIEIVSP